MKSYTTRRNVLRIGAATTGFLATSGVLAGAAAARRNCSSVTITDQEVNPGHLNDGTTTLLVKQTYLPEGGYMSIHDVRRRLDHPTGKDEHAIPDSFVGLTEHLEPGVHHDLEVPLYPEHTALPGDPDHNPEYNDEDYLLESQSVLAIPHQDISASGGFELGVDVAYTDGTGTLRTFPPVHDIATIYFEGDSNAVQRAAKREESQFRQQYNSGR